MRKFGTLHSKIRRERLPDTAMILDKLNLTSSHRNASGFVLVCCPIHFESHASLSIHYDHGHWHCFACGAKGSSPIKLYAEALGLTFRQAAQDFGAWAE
jgi:DNA primase